MNLGAHSLPKTLVNSIGREILIERNGISKKKKGAAARHSVSAVNKRWQDRQRGLVPQMEYSQTLDEAIKKAGL